MRVQSPWPAPPRAAVSTSVLTATDAACELRYLRLGGGRPVVLLHPLRMQLEYFQPLIKQLDTEANLRATGARQLMLLSACGHFSCLDRPGQVAKLIEGVLR
jgi:hypothetical protein